MVNTTRIVGLVFLLIGIGLLVSELFFEGALPLVLGAGTSFLGVYTIAMSTERYVKADVLVAGFEASMENIDRVLRELKVSGRAVFLPKRYAGEPRIFLPARTGEITLPDLRGDPTFLTGVEADEAGILLFPPGHGLCILLEGELESEMEGLEPEAVATMIPPLLCQGLGLAKSIDIDEEKLTLELRSPVTFGFYGRNLKGAEQIGCPVSSCISEALSRSLDAALMVESVRYESGRELVEVVLRRLEG